MSVRTGPLPARVALVAGPLLRGFNDAGILAASDVQVARRLGRLTGESDERVLLVVALAVRAVRSGSVCVALDDLDALAVPETEDSALADAAVPPPPWPDLDGWRAAIEASPLVAVGPGPVPPVGPDGAPAPVPDPPGRWVDGRFYLDRYWRDEQVVRTEVDGRLARGVLPTDPERVAAAVRRLFEDQGNGRQRLTAAVAASSRVTVLTGGPGTGKTTTVARLLAALHSVAGPGLRVALAAPTGKAAARLQESVRAELESLAGLGRGRFTAPDATTVHRLLGWRPGSSTRFAHDRDRRLPHDVVVVDETSMVSLPLMARLLEALRPDARLVLVGDPDQLASVEAGAVLGDLVARPPVADGLPAALPPGLVADAALRPDDAAALRNGVVRLVDTYRFGSTIGDLADAIRAGQADTVLEVLRSGDRAISFVETEGAAPTDDDVEAVRTAATTAGAAVVAAARRGDVRGALEALESHRLLLAHRRGPFGVARWAAFVETWVLDTVDEADAVDPVDDASGASGTAGSGAAGSGAARSGAGHGGGACRSGPWYPGRPLLVTANDRETGLYNGDTGVLVATDGGLVAAFGDPASPLRVRPHRLPAVETVHATTVHRGQGSQFRSVSVVLPPPESPLLTRELLYTAVTRAREEVRIVGSADAVRVAVERPVRRASGLRVPLGSVAPGPPTRA